jgi:hypothetical protein
MKKVIFFALSLFSLTIYAQSYESMVAKSDDDSKKLLLGGYMQVDYRQPMLSGEYNNGKLDVHRMVLLMAYRFNDRISFMSEIEIEHASEIYLEQAYLNYRFKNWLQFRAGLLLIPMGIINENHEPPLFNGVVRPSLDYYIVPTTWREIGMGFSGNISSASLKYSLYVINGVLGYDDGPKLNGKYGIRKGRQKGISSVIGSPNFTGRIEYFGLKDLKVGLSGYYGETQTTLNNSVPLDDTYAIDTRDSTIVTMSMIGIDLQYAFHGFGFRGQLNYASFANSEAYNTYSSSDLGRAMLGYYLEASYNVFRFYKKTSHQLIPFVRYENYNTQHKVSSKMIENNAYHREEITAGLGWRPIYNVVLKADYQWMRSKSETGFKGMLNLGVGLMF